MFWAVAISASITTIWHFPGHMTVDSVVQMYEGFTGDYQSYNPPFMSMLLGWSYAATATQAGFFVANLCLFFCGLWLWLRSHDRLQIVSAVLILVVSVSPVVLTYNGIIWKDVFFANLAVLGFAVIAKGAGIRSAMLALVLLTLAAETRQQGLLCLAIAIPVLVVRLWLNGVSLPRKLATIGVYFAVIAVTHMATQTLVQANSRQPGMNGYSAGVKLLQIFDFAGVYASSDVSVARLEKYASHDYLMQYFQWFSPQRIDSMDQYKEQVTPMWSVPMEERTIAWMEMMREYPSQYLNHRATVWSWLLGFHDLRQCVPFNLGVSEAPANYVAALGLRPGLTPREQLYYSIVSPMVDAYFRPWPYVLLNVCLVITLSVWSWRKHVAMIAMQITALAYVASYFFIGIACDVRYVYFSILSSLVGLAYLLLQTSDWIQSRSISKGVR